MASQEDILIKINVDNKESVKSVKEIDKSVDNLNGTLSDLDKIVDSSFGDMGETINETTDEQKELAKATDETADSTEKLAKSGKNANKGMKILSKGLKGVGMAFKAMGIGALIGILVALWEAMKKNQKIMDAIDTVMQAVSIVFNKVTEAIVFAYEKASDATGGFDAMKVVVMNLLKIAIIPLKLSFYAIKTAVIAAQLAWEKSFFGGKDPEKIKSLTADLKEIKDDVIEMGKDAIESGKLIATNLKEAVNEVATLTKTIVADVSESINSMTVESLLATADALVQSKKALAELEIQQEGLNFKYLQQAELQRQLRDDTSLTLEERIAANDKISKILEKQYTQEEAIIKKKIKIAQAESDANKDNHEMTLELMRLENEKAELLERITGQRSEQIVNQVGLEQEALDKGIEQIEENNKVILAFQKQTEVEKLEATKKANELIVEESGLSLEKKNELLKQIQIDFDAEMQEMADAVLQKKKDNIDAEIQANKDKNKKIALDSLEIAQATSNAISSILELRLQTQINSLNKSQAEEIKNAEGNEEEIAKINKKYAKEKADLEYEAAKQRKAMALIDAVIQGGLVILSFSKEAGLAGPIIAGALIASTIGIIAATPIPKPEYEFGGVIPGTTTHAQGGVDINAEGGEGMINNVSMRNPDLRNLASAANEGGGGVAFGDGNGIKLDAGTIARIGAVINSKKVVLNTNELSDKNDEVDLINNESYL